MSSDIGESLTSATMVFPIKDPRYNITLGEYLPLENLAWAFNFPRNSLEGLCVYAHEFLSHPAFFLFSDIHSDMILAYCADKEEGTRKCCENFVHKWSPIIEGTALARLYFLDRNLYCSQLFSLDAKTVNFATTLISLVKSLEKTTHYDFSSAEILDPFAKMFLNAFYIDHPFQVETLAAAVLWGGRKLMKCVEAHLHNPRRNEIPKDLKQAFWERKIQSELLWLVALFLSIYLLSSNSLLDQLIAVSFFSRQLLEEVRKTCISFMGLSSHSHEEQMNCLFAAEGEISTTYSEVLPLDHDTDFVPKGTLQPKSMRRPSDLLEIPSLLVVNYLMAYARHSYLTFKKFYVTETKGGWKTLGLPLVYAASTTINLITQAFRTWQETKTTKGLGLYFSLLEHLRDDYVVFSPHVKKLTQLVAELISNFKSTEFEGALFQALQNTNYYDPNTFGKYVVAFRAGPCFIKNLKTLPPGERDEFIKKISRALPEVS